MRQQDASKQIKRLFRLNPGGYFTQSQLEAALGMKAHTANANLRILVARRYLKRERTKEGFVYFRYPNRGGRQVNPKRTVLSSSSIAEAAIKNYRSREFTARNIVDDSGVSRGVIDLVIKKLLREGEIVVRQEDIPGGVGYRNIYRRADSAVAPEPEREDDSLLAGLKLLVLDREISDQAFRVLMFLATTPTPIKVDEIAITFRMSVRQAESNLEILERLGVLTAKAAGMERKRYQLHIPEL